MPEQAAKSSIPPSYSYSGEDRWGVRKNSLANSHGRPLSAMLFYPLRGRPTFIL
jgi:hypothetical protein